MHERNLLSILEWDMNLDRINAALKKTHRHVKGKRNFLAKVCSLQIDHEQVKCASKSMRVQTPFLNRYGKVLPIYLELSMHTAEHTSDDIREFIKHGIVPHNPKFCFTLIAGTMRYAVHKEIKFNDLPDATIEYLTSLYYKNYDNIQGSYLESDTYEQDYAAFRQDFGAIFSTLLNDFSPSICVTSHLVYGTTNRVRINKYNEESVRRQHIMQCVLDDQGLEGTLIPFGDDTVFNFEVLGYSENHIIDAINRISILAPGRGYEKFNDDADAIFEAWHDGEPR